MELIKYKEKLADLTAKNPELGEAAAMLMSRSIQAGTKINELDYNEEPPEKLCFQIFNRTITIDTTIKHIVVQGDTTVSYKHHRAHETLKKVVCPVDGEKKI